MFYSNTEYGILLQSYFTVIGELAMFLGEVLCCDACCGVVVRLDVVSIFRLFCCVVMRGVVR